MTTTLKCGRGGPRLKFECEFCGEFAIASAERTVCDGCDSALAATQEKELADKAKRWALSHKCRQCGDGLPLSRYFDCEDCLKDADRETAWEWDAIPVVDEREAFIPASAVPTAKECKRCHTTHPIAAYSLDNKHKDGRSTMCLPCRQLHYTKIKAGRAAKKAAREAAEVSCE